MKAELVFFFQAEDGIRDLTVTGVQTCALPIWILPAIRELGIEIADVAKIVVKGAQNFRPDAQVQRQIRPNFPIILREKSEVVVAVLVVEDAASAKAEIRRSHNEFLKIRGSPGAVYEEQLSIKRLRK